MKVDKNSFTKIETNVKRFIKENDLKEVTISTISSLHHLFCLSIREPNNANIISVKEKYIFNPDKDYFNNFYLNNEGLNDNHLETVFKAIIKRL